MSEIQYEFGDDECPKCGAGLEIFEDGARCFECDWVVEFGNEFDFSAAENLPDKLSETDDL